ALVVALARLRAEVAVLEHPCKLDDALELDLAPAAAHVRRAQRGHEATGLGAELLLAVGDLAEPLADRRHLAGALVLELPRLRLHLRRRSLDGGELALGQLGQRALAFDQDVAGRRLETALPVGLMLQLLLRARDSLAAPEERGADADRQ